MKKNSKITIIGTGAMGTAMGKVLNDAGHNNLVFYGVDATELADLARGINTKYFANAINLPNFKVTNQMASAVDQADYIILAVPSKVMDLVYAQVLAHINAPTVIINVAKGFFPGLNCSLHDGLNKVSAKNEYIQGIVSLSGPSHAEEIVQELLTIVAVVAQDQSLGKKVQQLFTNAYFKTYIQTDIKGAEAGAAYKNILAIVAGIAEGLGLGINAKAALITRGLVEMSRYNKAVKGKPATILGLTGLGDLIVTATSKFSRNYQFGILIAKKGVDEALKTNTTVEGYSALKYVYDFKTSHQLDLPIVEILHQVLTKTITVQQALAKLWTRDLKSE